MDEKKEIRVAAKPVCLLCGSLGRLAHEHLRDRFFGSPGEWTLRRCANRDCGFVWLDPMPVAEDLALAYERYYTHGPAAGDDERPAARRSMFDRLYRTALDLASITEARHAARDLYLGDTTPGRLLEVGCGDGKALLRLKALGWEVEGQDIDPNAGAHSLGESDVRVHKAPLEELGLPGGRYDAIVMNHAIEHALGPQALLGECRRLLAQDGQLVLVTPNSDSLGHRLFGACWMHLDPPRHVFLYSVRTLPALVRKAGFTRVETWSSVANAGSVGVVSWDIFRRGCHKMNETPIGFPKLFGVAFQLAAGMVFMVWRSGGEEVVLRARR
jgi:SAM-dependent methyltransferase